MLSVLPIAVIGLWGLRWLRWLDRVDEESLYAAPLPVDALDCAWIFFAGLILTALGSVFYHLQPDGLRLAADRAGLSVVFAGLIGFAVCERMSARAGWPAAWFTLAGSWLAAAVCHKTGNVLPWALAQFGGLALLFMMLALTRPVDGTTGLKLGRVIFFFALAKLIESADPVIFEATGRLVSGLGLKHLAVAFAALPMLHALRAIGRQALRHNPNAVTVTA
jgi:hypothetical protein